MEKVPLSSILEEFTVLPAYPNPFNPSTTITYGINEDSKVTIDIYDITGQLINKLLNSYQEQGWHSVEWNGTDSNNNQVPAGIYLSKITSNNDTKTTKLMLLK
ncbi:MAG: T9SS type A sorting domain-containing protein [Planctomycetia bacterium]|nr:T9SS type A sorting domain-containing protein [Planctomycetia bacterium]